ncbi:MAG: hypothetical protein Salg2KO_02480 [Salibacteraceae bacterium]
MKKFILPIASAAVLFSAIGLSFIKEQKSYQQRTSADRLDLPGVPSDYNAWARRDLNTGEFNPNARTEAMKSAMANSTASRAGTVGDFAFVQEGPDNVGGRTRAVIEIYGKPDTMLAGSMSGGLYISYDNGGNWERHQQFNNQDSSSSIISAIHQDTSATGNGRIYIGTGNVFDDQWPGFGIYYSDDDGITFNHLTSTTPDNRYSTGGSPWLYIQRIRTDGAGNVFAATDAGLKRSTDRGVTWEDVIFLDPEATIPTTSTFADVIAMKSGRVLASTINGAIYMSEENGEPGSFRQLTQQGMPSTGMSRTLLAYSKQNEDHIYAMFINPNSCMNSLWETINASDENIVWTQLLEPYQGFNPMSNSVQCQGIYDACLGVSPKDENLFFLGGVEIWRYDGNLTRVASEFGSPPFQDVLQNYVHADKHYVYFSPNNERRVYVTSDGGISRSDDDGETWQGVNKGYISTQFYSIAHANDGDLVLGGTQDNGTLVVLGDNQFDPKVGFALSGGDGLDADMSQISEIIFTSSQRGVVNRIDGSQRSGNNFPVGRISSAGGPFRTVLRLWESPLDPTSQDSIEFSVEPTEFAFEVSNGVVKNYTATITPVQPNAQVIRSSIEVFAGSQLLTVSEDDDEVLVGSGSSSGSISYNEDGSFDVDVTFNNAPTENTPIEVRFDKRFEANDLIYLKSENLRSGPTEYTFEHRLENSLNPGDVIKVQDPVQSVLAHTGGVPESTTGGIRLIRNPLDFLTIPEQINVPGVGGTVSCVEFTSNGDAMFVGTYGGALYRVTGINQLYTEDDADDLDVTNLQNFSGGVIGIAVDPNDDNHIVVTSAGYNSTGNVWSTNTALSTGDFTNIHGDLPRMPVYDAIIDYGNENLILVGTEFGLYATEQGDSPTPEWVDVNEDLTYVPVYALEQQGLPWKKAKNNGMVFVGTYGAGMWRTSNESSAALGTPEITNKASITGLKVFPNPMNSFGTIAFESAAEGNIDLQVYDMNGRVVISKQVLVSTGENRINLNTSRLPSGAYYATVKQGGKSHVAKMMVFK